MIRFRSLAMLAPAMLALCVGCARPTTFAEPAGIYQPPVVSPGYDAAPDPYAPQTYPGATGGAPLGVAPAAGRYAPPAQSYSYRQGAAAQTSPDERTALYEKYYGQYYREERGGGQSLAGATSGASDAQNKAPGDAQPDPANPFANHASPDGGVTSRSETEAPVGGISATDAVSSTQPRRMVPIQHSPTASEGASNYGLSRSLNNGVQHNNTGRPPGAAFTDLTQRAPATNRGGLPYSVPPTSAVPPFAAPRGHVPAAGNVAAENQNASRDPVGSSTPLLPGGANSTTNGMAAEGMAAASEDASPATPPALSYPAGGRWPQKPIPRVDESR